MAGRSVAVHSMVMSPAPGVNAVTTKARRHEENPGIKRKDVKRNRILTFYVFIFSASAAMLLCGESLLLLRLAQFERVMDELEGAVAVGFIDDAGDFDFAGGD